MRNMYVLFTVFIILFSSCETEFDVNAEWKETTVVYGLLDASLDTQLVRINKAYLGEIDALEMAQYSDSINFNPSNLEVKLHQLQYNEILESITLDTILIIKDTLDANGNPAVFSVEKNIIYQALTPNGFLRGDRTYMLTIKNLISGNEVSASTELISGFSFESFNSSYKFGFYNGALPDSTKFRSKTIEWDKVYNGVIYQLDVRFNYLENGELKHLTWNQGLVTFNGSLSMKTTLEGAKFFNFLSKELEDPVFQGTREFIDLDLVMTVGTEELNTYIQLNEPISGIVQQRPDFTNINNGIGIFSSRYTHSEFGINLTDDTRQYLIDELDRNFQ